MGSPRKSEWVLDARGNHDAVKTYQAAVAPLFEVLITEDVARRFRNHVEGYNLGSAVLTRCRGVAQTFIRSRRQARGGAFDQIQIMVDLQGSARCDYDTIAFESRTGGVRVVDMAQPFRTETSDFETFNLVIPRAALGPEWRDKPVHGAALLPDSPASGLLAAYIASVWQSAPNLSEREAVAAVSAALTLAAAALETEAIVDGEATAMRRPSLKSMLRQARDYIDANLGDQTLSPERIGAHLGISRRSLYRLFDEHNGVST